MPNGIEFTHCSEVLLAQDHSLHLWNLCKHAEKCIATLLTISIHIQIRQEINKATGLQ